MDQQISYVRPTAQAPRTTAAGDDPLDVVEEKVVKILASSPDALGMQTADALYLSKQHTRALAEVMPMALFICDKAGLITYYNQRAAELWGRHPKLNDPADKFCGSFRIYRPDGARLPHHECPMAVAVLTGRGTRHEEITIERPDGTTLLASVNIDPLFDQAGRPIGAINVFEDITQRKQAEERLQVIYQVSEAVNRAEAIEQIYEAALLALERVLHVDRAAILLLDEAGVMRFKAWHSLSTAYRQQVEGHSPWTTDEPQPQPVLIPNVGEAELGALREIILGEGIGALAFIPLVEQGRLFGKFMLYYNQAYPFPEAEVQWAQTIGQHVAHALQRKYAEEQLRHLNATLEQRVVERTLELEQRNRDLDQFAYVASHDLKAPLRAVDHLAQWISQDAAAVLPAASQVHLTKLRSRIQRMDTLLTDLLAYSRAGRQRHPPEDVETAALVRDVVELLAPPSGFTVRVAEGLPTLITERVPLETVLRNLLGNALKHHDHPNTGQVSLAAVEQGPFVRFTVSDDGPGIDPQFHARIFQLFQTLKPRDQVEGSGMGLAVVKKLVESRGGTIQLESSVGQGATFRFTWPKVSLPQ